MQLLINLLECSTEEGDSPVSCSVVDNQYQYQYQ